MRPDCDCGKVYSATEGIEIECVISLTAAERDRIISKFDMQQ
jgi:surfactin synthase thioesterase subunit